MGRSAQLRVLQALGTLAHNKSFTQPEVMGYVSGEGIPDREVRKAIAHFKTKGWIKSVGGLRLYPTARGWRAIELAHKVSK